MHIETIARGRGECKGFCWQTHLRMFPARIALLRSTEQYEHDFWLSFGGIGKGLKGKKDA